MKSIQKGWVVLSKNHPKSNTPIIVPSVFSSTKKAAIQKFVYETGYSWNYWKNEYNYEAVKATLTVETLEP